MDGHGTTWRRNVAENFNRLSRVHQRYRRQTDRETDGRWHIANFAKNYGWLVRSKLTEFGTNRKLICECDFLLVINTNLILTKLSGKMRCDGNQASNVGKPICACRDINQNMYLLEGFLMTPGSHDVSGHWPLLKYFRGQRSSVMVMAISNAGLKLVSIFTVVLFLWTCAKNIKIW